MLVPSVVDVVLAGIVAAVVATGSAEAVVSVVFIVRLFLLLSRVFLFLLSCFGVLVIVDVVVDVVVLSDSSRCCC